MYNKMQCLVDCGALYEPNIGTVIVPKIRFILIPWRISTARQPDVWFAFAIVNLFLKLEKIKIWSSKALLKPYRRRADSVL